MTRSETWILGATGRVGSAVAARLAAKGVAPVLVGRNPERLRHTAATVADGARIVEADTPEQIAVEVRRERPAVVVNTIGPFTRTSVLIARACLPGGHYVDLANDIVAVTALLGLHDEAVAARSTLVTGVGFGVLATESVVANLCQSQPTPSTVRVDAVPSVAIDAGTMGQALAATIVEALPTGGRRYENESLVKTRIGADVYHVTLPDGETVTTVGVPTGELHAAWLASRAATVTATSSEVPSGRVIRTIMPVASALMSIPPLRRLATRQLANVRLQLRPRPREHSWAHAIVRWPHGGSREGWLRTGDGMTFTAAVLAEAQRA